MEYTNDNDDWIIAMNLINEYIDSFGINSSKEKLNHSKSLKLNSQKIHPLTVRVDDCVYNKLVKYAQMRCLKEKRLVNMTKILREAIEEKILIEEKRPV